jgi:hypothetical protein
MAILASTVKLMLPLPISPSLAIERATSGENPFTASSADDTAATVDIVFTTGSYTELLVKAFMTAGYSARRVPMGNKPTVIRITADYLKTIGEGPGSELTFCSSDGWSSCRS